MDPRHPEQAISRLRELMKQYDRIEADMNKATTSAKLAELEREGGLVIQEICLVAPRIHEAMMQTSRQRRHDLARGVLIEPQDTAVELPELTPEEEEHFAKLLAILDDAKEQFDGKDARNKETGEVYGNLYFMTIKPFESDSYRYGIVVSMDDGKEILSFYNEKVVDFLNGYEPVEKTSSHREISRNRLDKEVNEVLEPLEKPKRKRWVFDRKTTKKAKK